MRTDESQAVSVKAWGVAGCLCMLVFTVTLFFPAAQGGARSSQTFDQWLVDLRQEALAAGVSNATVRVALPDTLRPIARVVELDRKQPEKTRSHAEYLAGVVSDTRVDRGRTRYLNHRSLLSEIGEKYGVDPATIVALWGVETNYGAMTGGHQVVAALATLAYDGRRAAFFRGELINALKILDQGHVSLDEFKGSWAGAMGQCQFMPSSFLRYSVDYDGDGRRDIWGTEADVFASTANYLSNVGWRRGEAWGQEVRLPAGFDRRLVGGEVERPQSFWQARGVRAADGGPLRGAATLQAGLIQPDGPEGRAFLVYENYKVLLRWNRSSYFATSVGLLSDDIRKTPLPGLNN